MSVYHYTEEDKRRIKSYPSNRNNCRNIRVITTWKYREFQAAERSLAAANDKNRAEVKKKYDDAKAVYEEALNKFKLYKELYPDLVQ